MNANKNLKLTNKFGFSSDVLTVDSSAVRPDGSSQSNCGFEFLSQGSGIGGMQRITTSQVEASLIGQQIAKEMGRRTGDGGSNNSTPSPASGHTLENESSLPLSNIEVGTQF